MQALYQNPLSNRFHSMTASNHLLSGRAIHQVTLATRSLTILQAWGLNNNYRPSNIFAWENWWMFWIKPECMLRTLTSSRIQKQGLLLLKYHVGVKRMHIYWTQCLPVPTDSNTNSTWVWKKLPWQDSHVCLWGNSQLVCVICKMCRSESTVNLHSFSVFVCDLRKWLSQ